MAAFQTLLGLGGNRTSTACTRINGCEEHFEIDSRRVPPTYGGRLKQPDKQELIFSQKSSLLGRKQRPLETTDSEWSCVTRARRSRLLLQDDVEPGVLPVFCSSLFRLSLFLLLTFARHFPGSFSKKRYPSS